MQESQSASKSASRRALISVIITTLLGCVVSYLSMNAVRSYGSALFIYLPFAMGALFTLMYGWNNPTGFSRILELSILSLAILFFGLMILAWEGAICLIMAAPISLLANILGCLLAYQFIKKKPLDKKSTYLLILLPLPVLMSFEGLHKPADRIRSVTTSIQIAANPETVWKNVIAFSPLEEPTELIFKAGIAYPIDATIEGTGVGAIRYCNFSTGSFVEPITVWDEPRLLKFSVTEQPEPMKELSPYNIHPNHLNGYWVSKEGQFKLTLLSNGNTLLEGTTWYVNKIKPGFYWTLWSDFIVHKIHGRVLEHIKRESED